MALALAPGDRLQLKANSRAQDGRRLAKGELVTVAQVTSDARIVLDDGRVLDKGYRQFGYGYAITSYGSQGKTIDHVLFSDSAVKAATNQQQWYVTISRGRRGIRIFTCDKEQLRENICRTGDRELALELTPMRQHSIRRVRRSLTRARQMAARIARSIATYLRQRRQPETTQQAQTV